MKATGIVRRIDELGRIVLPIELRRTMDIEERDRVEIYLEDDLIIVRKFEQTCLFCGAARNLIAFKEKSVCRDCIRALNKKSRRLKEEPHMHRQRKHRTYGVSAVCRKSAGIEKHTGSDSARSIRIPNVEEAALTEQLGETEPGQSALSFHRTGGETLDEAPLQKHEDHRDRDGRDDGGRNWQV